MIQTKEIRIARSSPDASLSARTGRGLSVAWQTMKVWYERSMQRRHLLELDDYLLRDIGLDRVAAMKEAAKPFWRG
jgi:uncharacterized protein YjiS (DUF1127 family)